jgi:hypothetical protein
VHGEVSNAMAQSRLHGIPVKRKGSVSRSTAAVSCPPDVAVARRIQFRCDCAMAVSSGAPLEWVDDSRYRELWHSAARRGRNGYSQAASCALPVAAPDRGLPTEAGATERVLAPSRRRGCKNGHDSRIFRRTCTPYWKVSRPRKPRERNSACDAISLSDRILRYRLRARTVRASGLQVGYI